uniref:purine-nucleoside phosphorylase n=1 Tax=Poecilia formosa TaxID=48698 RepID=A0A087XSC0_POEFO
MLSKGSSCCYSFDDYKLTTEWLQNQTRHRPKVAVICGSGLGLLAEAAADKQTFRYQDIPNFPVSTVPGHEGCLVFGTIEETPCVFMKGHFHLYEGYSLCQLDFFVRCTFLNLSYAKFQCENSAGWVVQEQNIMNLLKLNVQHPGFCPPAPLTSQHQNQNRSKVHPDNFYNRSCVSLRSGSGSESESGSIVHQNLTKDPNHETPHPCGAEERLGSSVRMSMVPEVTVAKHCGLRVLGLTLVTNKVSLDYSREEKVNHDEVLEICKMRAELLQKLVSTLIGRCQQNMTDDPSRCVFVHVK